MNTIRKRFAHQLDTLREDLSGLGTMVEQALNMALKSLETWDTTLAEQVIRNDAQIDATQYKMEKWGIAIIAMQQPVASDLRLIGSVFAIAAELERIGDYAKHIARRVRNTSRRPVLVPPPSGLKDMAALALKMLHTSLEAFLRQDIAMAYSLVDMARRVEEWEETLRKELLDIARNDPQSIEAVRDMLDVVHALERLSDRSINIGERVIYLETSVMEELSP